MFKKDRKNKFKEITNVMLAPDLSVLLQPKVQTMRVSLSKLAPRLLQIYMKLTIPADPSFPPGKKGDA